MSWQKFLQNKNSQQTASNNSWNNFVQKTNPQIIQRQQQAQAQQSQQVTLNVNQPQVTKKKPTSFIDKVKNFLGINIQDQLDTPQLLQLDLQSQQDISRQIQINKITQQESGQSARLPTKIEEEYLNKQKSEQSQKRQEAINILQTQEIPSWKTEAESSLKEAEYNYAKFFYGDKWDILSEDEKNKIAEAIRTDNFKIPESERKRLAVENTLSQQIGGVSNFNVINEQLIQAKANLEMIDKLSSMDTDTQRNFWKIVEDAAHGTSDVSLPIIGSYLDLSDAMIRAGIQIKEKNGEELSTGEKIFKQKQLNKQTWDEISPETLDYKIAEGLLNMVSTGIEFFAYGGLAEELTEEQTAKLSGNKFVKSLLSEEAGKTKTAALRKLLADTIVDTPKIATQIALTQATPLADAVARTDWTQDDSYKNFVKQLIKSEATHTIETGGEYVIGDTYKAVFDDASKLVFGKNGVNQAISSANAKIAADNGIKSVTGMGLDDFMKISGYDGYVFEVLEEFTQNIASGLVQEGKLELPSADEVAITMISMGLYTALLGGSNALGTKFAYDEIKKNEALKEEAISQFTSELQKVDKNITDEQAREMFDGVLEEYSIQEKEQEEIETEDEKEPAIIPEIQQEQTQAETQEQEAAPTEQVTETAKIESQEKTEKEKKVSAIDQIKNVSTGNIAGIRGGSKDFKLSDGMVFLTTNNEDGQAYARANTVKSGKNGTINNILINKDTSIFDATSSENVEKLRESAGDEVTNKIIDNIKEGQIYWSLNGRNVAETYKEEFKKAGFDGTILTERIKGDSGFGKDGKKHVFNDNVYSIALFDGNKSISKIDSQPDFVESTTKEKKTEVKQAEKETQKTKTIKILKTDAPVKSKGETKVSRLESRMKGVLDQTNKMSDEELDSYGLTKYKQSNNSEQISKATEFVENDPKKALDVLQGKADPPVGILNNSILVAYMTYANDSATDGDYQAIMALGTLRATRLGQEIQILSKIDTDSAAAKVNEIYNIRVQEVQRDTGKNYRKEVSSIEKEASKEARKNTKSDWIAFIESIKC